MKDIAAKKTVLNLSMRKREPRSAAFSGRIKPSAKRIIDHFVKKHNYSYGDLLEALAKSIQEQITIDTDRFNKRSDDVINKISKSVKQKTINQNETILRN